MFMKNKILSPDPMPRASSHLIEKKGRLKFAAHPVPTMFMKNKPLSLKPSERRHAILLINRRLENHQRLKRETIPGGISG